jgi:hypothetical protein
LDRSRRCAAPGESTHPYGEGEITFLEEEVLPAIRECLVLRKNAKDLTYQLLYEKIGWKYMLAR